MSARTIEGIGWVRRLRVYGYAGACMLTAACTGEIATPASPLVEKTPLSLGDPVDEELTLPPSTSKIKIKRDARGVPHVTAKTEEEGYYGLCFAIAQDRLFQLESLRRMGQGRLGEVSPDDASGSILAGDTLARVLNLPVVAEDRLGRMDGSTQTLMQACSDGINLFIDRGALPPEFSVLPPPDRWKPHELLAVSMGVAANLDQGIIFTKLQLGAIIANNEEQGPAIAEALFPPPPALSMFDAKGKLNPLGDFISEPGPASNRRARIIKSDRIKDGWRAPERRSTGLGEAAGPESNNYAADGTLTNSGRPMLANDPHLPLSVPSLAYAAQLTVEKNINGQRMNVEGITFPGFPTFVSGRTDKSAWGVTFLLLDGTDLFIETISDVNGKKMAMINNVWTDVEVRQETIAVNASQSFVTIEVLVTDHGPVLNPTFPPPKPGEKAPPPIALKSTVAQDEWSIDGLINLPRTKNWAEFSASARTSGIGFNFLYSDETGSSGKIGYQATGLVPLRKCETSEWMPVFGDDGSCEWNGFANPALLPSVYNPTSHALATANNRIVPDDYEPGNGPRLYLSHYYDEPWRAQRLYTRLLQNAPLFKPAEFASIQLDKFSVFNLPLRDTFVSALDRAGVAGGADADAAFQVLKQWDGNVDAGSNGAGIYETLLFVLLRNTAKPVLKDDYRGYASSVFITQQQLALQDLLAKPRAPFFGIVAGDDGVTIGQKRDRAVRAALRETAELLRAVVNAGVPNWTWGAIHKLTYNHPFAAADPAFAIGKFPAHGDASTPWIGGYFLHAGDVAQAKLRKSLRQDALQVARVLWEPSKNRSLITLSTGQSGDPTSTHYKDQVEAWRTGQYFEIPFFQ